MKVAISANGANLEAQADPRFGRCAYFVIVDTDTMQYEVLTNPGVTMGSGAGIQAAQAVARAGAQAVVAGNFGPNAINALSAGGIQAYLGGMGTVRQTVEAFKAGQLQVASSATVPARSGMGMGTGGGMGQGTGMGGGMGRGGGMGGGMGGGRRGGGGGGGRRST